MTTEQHSTTHHVMPVRTYLIVFALLMLLLAATIGVAFLHLGPFNRIVAILIAMAKAGLIMAFFMHLRYSNKLTIVFAGMGFFWLIILLLIGMGDYFARGTIPGTF